MTDAGHRGADAPQVIRELVRRAGHEIRNALSGASVNVEVVRGRASRSGGQADIATFADRASAQIGEASSLADGLLALVGSVLAAQAAGTLATTPGYSGGTRIELMIYGGTADLVVSDIERLASRIGVGVEQRGQSVILTILPEGKSHSKD